MIYNDIRYSLYYSPLSPLYVCKVKKERKGAKVTLRTQYHMAQGFTPNSH